MGNRCTLSSTIKATLRKKVNRSLPSCKKKLTILEPQKTLHPEHHTGVSFISFHSRLPAWQPLTNLSSKSQHPGAILPSIHDSRKLWRGSLQSLPLWAPIMDLGSGLCPIGGVVIGSSKNSSNRMCDHKESGLAWLWSPAGQSHSTHIPLGYLLRSTPESYGESMFRKLPVFSRVTVPYVFISSEARNSISSHSHQLSIISPLLCSRLSGYEGMYTSLNTHACTWTSLSLPITVSKLRFCSVNTVQNYFLVIFISISMKLVASSSYVERTLGFRLLYTSSSYILCSFIALTFADIL